MQLREFAFLVSALAVMAFRAEGQVSAFLEKSQTSKAGVTLPYRLFVPKNYDPAKRYPLVFALHGYGERGSDNQKQLTIHQLATVWTRDTIQAKHPSFVLAPQCPANGNDSWIYVDFGKGTYSQDAVPISKYLSAAVEILDSTLARYGIDTNRVYAAGLSMGGYATWDVITRNPRRFAAAVPICGGGDTTKAPLISHMPLWVFHGDADRTVPVAGSRQMVASLRKAGGNPRYTEYPGVDHGSWGPALQEPDLPTWLFAQVRTLPVAVSPGIPGRYHRSSPDAGRPAKPRLVLQGRVHDPRPGDLDGLGRILP